MKPGTKRILKLIDEELVRQQRKINLERDSPYPELWDILAGFRGPDDDDSELKESVTAVIRKTALPKASEEPAIGFINNSDSADAVKVRKLRRGNYHFREHSMSAFKALGLQWNEENPEPEDK